MYFSRTSGAVRCAALADWQRAALASEKCELCGGGVVLSPTKRDGQRKSLSSANIDILGPSILKRKLRPNMIRSFDRMLAIRVSLTSTVRKRQQKGWLSLWPYTHQSQGIHLATSALVAEVGVGKPRDSFKESIEHWAH